MSDDRSDSDFQTELQAARELLDDDEVTAFNVGVVRNGEEVETTFSFEPQRDEEDAIGMQSLTLLATHLRVVASEAGVDLSTAAGDAVRLAEQVTEMQGRLAADDAE